MPCSSQGAPSEGRGIMFELLGKHRKRLVFAGLTALAGLIVSIAMMYLGEHHAGQLPGVAFHITATLGIMIGGYFNGLGGAIAFPALGFIAIIDAAESLHAVLVWLICMSGLHLLAGLMRRRGSV